MTRAPEHCEFCGRAVDLTFHHLIPRKVHRRARFKKYSRDDLMQGIWLCRPCHSAVHKQFDQMELATRLNSRDALLAEAAIQKHIEWVRKQRVRRVR